MSSTEFRTKVSKICYTILEFYDIELFVANDLRTQTVIRLNTFARANNIFAFINDKERLDAIWGRRDTNLNAASRIFANDSKYFRHGNPTYGQYQTMTHSVLN